MSAAARSATVLCILVLVVSPGVRAAEADKAREAFESLYGSDVKRAKASREAADDLNLAKRLLAAAKEATGQPEFLSVLCERAADLAADHAEGVATAVEAMEFLASSVPEKAGACAERVADIRQKQFDRSRGDAKTEAGEVLIDALLVVADAKVAAADPPGAISALRRAQAVDRTIKSGRQREGHLPIRNREEEMEGRLKALAQAMKSAREIEDLKFLLAKDAQNAALREKLVRLYLVDLDNPAEAATYLEGVAEESLKKYVPAAAKGIEAAPELACIDLGEWYRTLGEAATAAAKAAMYTRAKGYYERFLDLHAADDLDRTKATLALKKVEATLEKLGGGRAKTHKWIDLLALADPATDNVRGAWKRQGTALTASAAGLNKDQILSFPMTVKGSYEFQIVLARTAGNDVFGFNLPAGSAGVSFGLGWFDQRGTGFFPVNNKYPHEEANTACVRPGTVEPNRKYAFHITVVAQDAVVRMTTLLDGKPFVTWQGSPSMLSSWGSWGTPPGRISLACRNCDVVVSLARLRMLSGEAKPLRPQGAGPGKTSAATPTPPTSAQTAARGSSAAAQEGGE